MAISDLLCILGYVLITFSQSVLWLDIGRLSIGCGIGFLSYLVPVYISEIAPKNLRGGFATINPLMICCGMSFAYVLGTLVTWQTLAIIGVAPCLLQLPCLVVIPESPRWLARIGHPHEFEAALQKLRGKGIDISEEAAEIKDFTEKLQHQPKSKILDLFHKEYIRALTVGVGLMVLQQFGGMNAIYFYANEIFVSAGFSSGNTGMFAMVVVQAPVTGVAVLLMDKAGRRPLLMVSAAGTCLGCVLVGLSFLAKEHHWGKDLNIVLALAGILIFTGSFSIGMGGIPWVIMSEIFPINMKGTAGSFVTLVNWLGSWIVSYAFKFQLPLGVELLRHILFLCKHLRAYICVCGAAGARNQRKNTRRDSSLLSQMIFFLSRLDNQIPGLGMQHVKLMWLSGIVLFVHIQICI